MFLRSHKCCKKHLPTLVYLQLIFRAIQPLHTEMSSNHDDKYTLMTLTSIQLSNPPLKLTARVHGMLMVDMVKNYSADGSASAMWLLASSSDDQLAGAWLCPTIRKAKQKPQPSPWMNGWNYTRAAAGVQQSSSPAHCLSWVEACRLERLTQVVSLPPQCFPITPRKKSTFHKPRKQILGNRQNAELKSHTYYLSLAKALICLTSNVVVVVNMTLVTDSLSDSLTAKKKSM